MALIDEMFAWFMTSGAYDALLPFFLIFTLAFAFLQKVQMFGDSKSDNKRFNFLVSLIIALIVVVPHVTNSYPPGADVIQIILDALPSVLLWVVAIFSLWLLMAALGMPVTFGESTAGVQGLLTIVSIIVIAAIFRFAAGWFPPDWTVTIALGAIDPGLLQVILIIAIIVAVLGWLLSDSDTSQRPNRKGVGESIGDMFTSLGESLGNERKKR